MHIHRWKHVEAPGQLIGGGPGEGVCRKCGCIGQSWYDGLSGGYHRIVGRMPLADFRAIDRTLIAAEWGTTPTWPGTSCDN